MTDTECHLTCRECGRIFDLLDETDADEWAYGHDCEADEAEDAWRSRAARGVTPTRTTPDTLTGMVGR